MMGENPVKNEVQNLYVLNNDAVEKSDVEGQTTDKRGSDGTKENDVDILEPPNYPPPSEDEQGPANFSEVVLRHPHRKHNSNAEDRTGTLNSHHSLSTSDLGQYHVRPLRYYPKDNRNERTLILPLNRQGNMSALQSYQGSYREHNGHPTQTLPNPPGNFSPWILRPPSINSFHHGVCNNGLVITNGDTNTNTINNKHVSSSIISESHLSSTPFQRKKMFENVLGKWASVMYAVLIITLGVSLYVIDFLDLESDQINYLAEGLSLAVLLIALFYLIYLTIDIAIYMHRKSEFEKLAENLPAEILEMKSSHEGIHYNKDLQKALSLNKLVDHRYCLNKDRHSSNFYLKVGATGFCFGHLIHSILILTYRGIILSSSDESRSDCINVATYFIEVLYPLYSILLLFFIFKYSNIIINKNITLHRFGFMHCLAASLCFWIWTIFRETAEYIKYQQYKDDYGNDANANVSGNIYSKSNISLNTLAVITPFRFTKICEHDELNVLYQNYSPYLYPFSVEYSILVVGILYIVWVNIGLCASTNAIDEEHHGNDPRECKNYKPIEPESNVTIHADCHAANKGLFAGFIVLVFSIVSVILFFITFYNESTDLAENGRIVNRSTQIAIITLMIFAAVYAYAQMIKLDVNKVAHNSMDNFLLIMCLPAFFVHGTFSIIPAIMSGNVLAVIGIIFEIIQILIQTPFTIDGMARSSNSKELRKKKPGREMVTFLVICNVAMWLMQTFEVKSHGLDQYRQDFYSKELWSIVGHMCLPLMMFYRFHASACIGDIWKFAYIPSGH